MNQTLNILYYILYYIILQIIQNRLLRQKNTTFEAAFSTYEKQGTIKIDDFYQALKILGVNFEEEKNRVRLVVEELQINSKQNKLNMPQFRENYMRYKHADDSQDITFSKEDLRRVEAFANQIEKKLIKAKKSFQEVFTDKLKTPDKLSFNFEDVKNTIIFKLQMDESLDQRMFLRYIQNTGGQNLVNIDQLERLIMSKKDLNKDLFKQILEFVANTQELMKEFDANDYQQSGLISAIDIKRIIRKLKGPILEPEEIRLFADKLKVSKSNMILYKQMIQEARQQFEMSGLIGSNIQKLCAKIKQELLFKNVDLIELMKQYDRGNGRVRITALLQELKLKSIELTEAEQRMLFAVVLPDDAKQIDIYDLHRLIQKGTMELDRDELDCIIKFYLLYKVQIGQFKNKKLTPKEDEQVKVRGKNIQQLIKRIQQSAQQLMEEQGYTAKTLFRRMDRDDDEYISLREFSGAVQKLLGINASEEDFERVFEEFDSDRTFKLSLEEFEEAIFGIKQEANKITDLIKKVRKILLESTTDPTTQLLEVFNSIDINNDGFISFQEFQSTMRRLCPGVTQGEAEIIYKYFDMTNENRFSYDRFLSVLREDHLNLDMIRDKIDAYMLKQNLSLDAFYQQFANVRGQLLLKDLGRMMSSINFEITDDQLLELFEFLDAQKDNSLTKAEFRAIIFNKTIDTKPILKKLRRLCLTFNFDLEIEFRKKDERLTGQISYYSYNRLMKVFSQQLHPFEIELLFRMLDPKGSKLINYKEFIEKVQEINMDVKPIIEQLNNALKTFNINEEKLLKSFDKNRDGQLSMEEFDVMLQSFNILLPEVELMECFQAFDVNQSGYISLFEITSVLKQEKVSRQANIHLILVNKNYDRKQVERKQLSDNFFKETKHTTEEIFQRMAGPKVQFDLNDYEQKIRIACNQKKRDVFDVFSEYDRTDWSFQLENLRDLEVVFQQLDIQILPEHSQQFYYYYSHGQSYFPYISLCLRVSRPAVVFLKAIQRVMKKCQYTAESLFVSIAKKQPYWTIQEFNEINSRLNLGLTQSELKEVFEGWDLSKKGKLTKEQVFLCLGETAQQQDQAQVGKDEIFEDIMWHLKEIIQKQQLFYLYKKYDVKQKNAITWTDFERITRQIVPDILLEEMQALKQNLYKNNQIDLDEFKLALNYTVDNKATAPKKQVGFDLGNEQKKKKKQISLQTLDIYIEKIKQFVSKKKRTMEDLKLYYFPTGSVHQIDEKKFVQLTLTLKCGLNETEAKELFYFLDINGTGQVSINEFVITLMPDSQKISDLEQSKLINTLDEEIKDLFNSVDENQNGSLDRNELHKALVGIGINPGTEELQYYFNLFDKNQDDKISIEEFSSILKDFLRKELSQANDFLQELRKEFKAADTSNQRCLRETQVIQVFKKLGINVPDSDVGTLFKEIDQDQSGTVDIDEFIYFMQKNQSGMSAKAAQVIMNIKQSQRISLSDLKNIFQAFPANFTKSFLRAQTNQALNLPSSIFRPHLDPSGLFYSDIVYLKNYDVSQPFSVLEKGISQKFLAEFTFFQAEGIPIADEKDVPRDSYQYREVGVIIYDRVKSTFVGNTVYIKASWLPEYEDRWTFDSTLIIKFASFADKKDTNFDLILEFIAYVKRAGKVIELSCCHGEVSLLDLYQSNGKKTLELKGGAPNKVLSIDKKDIRTNRSGWRQMIKAIGGSVTTNLKYECKPIVSPQIIKDLTTLPDRCILEKGQLNYIRAFREYFAFKSVQHGELDTRLHYDNNVKSLLLAIDCPDTTGLFYFWDQRIEPKLNFQTMIQTLQCLGNSLFLLFSSSDFKLKRQNPAKRIFDQIDIRRRIDMLELVMNDLLTLVGVTLPTKKKQQALGYNLEPLNMLELMEEEDEDEIQQIERILKRKMKKKK